MHLRSFTLVPDHVVKSETIRTHSEANLPIARAIEALAEAQARKLHLADGYATMREFCVCELNLSEDEAAKRLQVAGAAHDHPAILPMLADGRLHQTAVVMLAPHLKKGNVTELLAAAARKSKAQIQLLLAERFPRPDVDTSIQVVGAAGAVVEVVARAGDTFVLQAPCESTPVPTPTRTPIPTSPGRFAVRFTLDEEAHRELEYARALNRRVAPCGDIAEFYRWAVQQAIQLGEKRAFGGRAVRNKQRGSVAAEPKGHHVPTGLKRAVWMRDEGRCTFVSESGRRCTAEGALDVDHRVPLAKDGRTTLENLRLLCPAHNQYEADRILGAGFMAEKRGRNREHACEPGAAHTVDVTATSQTQVPEPEISTVPEQVETAKALRAQREEIIPYLLALDVRLKDAKRAAAWCDHLLGQPLEALVKYALQQLVKARFERCTVRPQRGLTPVTSENRIAP